MKRKMMILTCTILLVTFLIPQAFAVDSLYESFDIVRLRHGNIALAKGNDYTADKPLIIFLPGSGECTSIRKTIGYMHKYDLYNDLDVNLIAAAFRAKSVDHRSWNDIAKDIVEYLKPVYEQHPFRIIVDCVSFGGYGGCSLTRCLRENGIIVDELNLADAVVQNIMNSENVREQLEGGTKVNVWACPGSANISRNTRKAMAELDGMKGFYGQIVQATHGKILGGAIHEHNLHSEYRYARVR